MRWLIRLIITWAILIPLGYFVGLPYVAAYMQAKAQTQTRDECAQQMHAKGLIGSVNSLLTAEQGDKYCHCLADPLTFSRADLFVIAKEMIKTGERKPPAHLSEQVNTQVNACNAIIEQAIMAKQRAAQPTTQPVPIDPTRAQTIIIN